jgi:hypothetical protein
MLEICIQTSYEQNVQLILKSYLPIVYGTTLKFGLFRFVKILIFITVDIFKHTAKKNKKIKRADQILPEVYGTTLNEAPKNEKKPFELSPFSCIYENFV